MNDLMTKKGELTEDGQKIFDTWKPGLTKCLNRENMKDFCRLCNLYGTYRAARNDQKPEGRKMAEDCLQFAQMIEKRIGLLVTYHNIAPDEYLLNKNRIF